MKVQLWWGHIREKESDCGYENFKSNHVICEIDFLNGQTTRDDIKICEGITWSMSYFFQFQGTPMALFISFVQNVNYLYWHVLVTQVCEMIYASSKLNSSEIV